VVALQIRHFRRTLPALADHADLDDLRGPRFAADDGIAVGIMKAAQEEKLAVPRQLAVAGFTDSEMATVVCPALTTVEHPYERLGTVAARRLIDLIENSELYDIETQEIVLKSKLKIRKSCGNKKNIYEQFE